MTSMTADPKQTHVAEQWKHGAPLITCRFDRSGDLAFSSGQDYTLQRWSLSTGECVSWPAHESWIRDLAFLTDNRTFVSAGCDDSIVFWPTTGDKPEPIRTVKAHDGWVRTVDASSNGQWLATGGNDKRVKLWKTDGTFVREFEGHDSDVYCCLFHPTDENVLLSGDLSGTIHQWEISTGKLLRSLDAKELHTYNGGQQVHYGGVRSIAISPDGKQLAAVGLHKATNPLGAVNEPLVVTFDWATGKKQKSHVAEGVKGIGWRVAYLADGSFVCMSGGSGGGFLIFWKANEEKAFHKLKLPDTARAMDLHGDGVRLATAHFDGHLRVSKMAPKAMPKKS